MVRVLCGLEGFQAAAPCTAAAVAKELTASLDPALADAGCIVEVYRLEQLEPEAQLGPDETVLCRIPSWRFDLESLEGLHRRLEDLTADHELLRSQHGRTKEALVQLNATQEHAEAGPGTWTSRAPAGAEGQLDAQPQPAEHARPSVAAAREAQESRQELQKLRQQLALSERNQQETKATVMALRSEFMHLVEVWSEAAPPKPQPAHRAASSPRPTQEPEKPGGRPRSQPPPAHMLGLRPRLAGAHSPQAYASTAVHSTPRPTGGPVRPRGPVHSHVSPAAGHAGLRQKPFARGGI